MRGQDSWLQEARPGRVNCRLPKGQTWLDFHESPELRPLVILAVKWSGERHSDTGNSDYELACSRADPGQVLRLQSWTTKSQVTSTNAGDSPSSGPHCWVLVRICLSACKCPPVLHAAAIAPPVGPYRLVIPPFPGRSCPMALPRCLRWRHGQHRVQHRARDGVLERGRRLRRDSSFLLPFGERRYDTKPNPMSRWRGTWPRKGYHRIEAMIPGSTRGRRSCT